MNRAAFWPRAAAAATNCAASDDLPVPAAPTISVLVPRSMPPPSSVSISAMPLASFSAAGRGAVLAGDQPRKDLDPAALDDVVVIAAAESDAAILEHDQPPPFRAVLRIQLLQPHHAVGDALHLQVVARAGHDRPAAARCSCGR